MLYSNEISRANCWFSDVTQAFDILHKRANKLLKRDLRTGDGGLPEVEVRANDLYDAVAKVVMDKSTRELLNNLKFYVRQTVTESGFVSES